MKESRRSVVLFCEQKLKALRDSYLNTLQRPLPKDLVSPEKIDLAAREQKLQDSIYFRDRIKAILPEVLHALERIKNGTFGICQITGEQIECRRLKAVPWTKVSIKAMKEAA
jgi:RNA polymerase-binding protein DksA